MNEKDHFGMRKKSKIPISAIREDGVLTAHNLVPTELIKKIQEDLENQVRLKHGFSINTHRVAADDPKRLNGINSIMENLNNSDNVKELTAILQKYINSIYDNVRWTPLRKCYCLVNFPSNSTDWNIPHSSWHSDEPFVDNVLEPWSLFAFIFLDHVSIDMGATLTVTGSHLRAGEIVTQKGEVAKASLINAFSSTNTGLLDQPSKTKILPINTFLEELKESNEWFFALTNTSGSPSERIDRFMKQESDHQDYKHRVQALTGQPGDIIFLDPRSLHTGSVNISNFSRQVIRIDFKRMTPDSNLELMRD